MEKPYAESCDQNRNAILEVLRDVFSDHKQVLEIGSGTGQHAVFFAKHLPHLRWQTSDLAPTHAGMNMWLEEAQLENVSSPLDIDVASKEWPPINMDAVFSANVVRIMSWHHVEKMFEGIGHILDKDGKICLYGPFNYNSKFTSDSNARFDIWLKERDPVSGIRDFEALDKLAQQQGMSLLGDYEMPANNRVLVWKRMTT
jgi:cyclopropane fatty-acyl-phospholipid synthase-like methyltransferase